jgi:hypothetical protein
VREPVRAGAVAVDPPAFEPVELGHQFEQPRGRGLDVGRERDDLVGQLEQAVGFGAAGVDALRVTLDRILGRRLAHQPEPTGRASDVSAETPPIPCAAIGSVAVAAPDSVPHAPPPVRG